MRATSAISGEFRSLLSSPRCPAVLFRHARFFDPRSLTDFPWETTDYVSTSNRHSVTRRHTGKSLFPTISSDGRAELRSFRTTAAFALDPLSISLSLSPFLFLRTGFPQCRPGRVRDRCLPSSTSLFPRSSSFFLGPFALSFPRLLLNRGRQSSNEATGS